MRAFVTTLLLATATPAIAADMPKNVIVMIADGSGHNTLAATRFWTGRPLTMDTGPWVRASMATYGLRLERKVPEGGDPYAQDPDAVYDPAKAWDTRPVKGMAKAGSKYPALFAGYQWHRRVAPDSANTMSAMMTGVRTFDGAIDVDGAEKPVQSIAEAAKAAGKMTGSITSVPFNHATPAAGGGAHNPDRDDYHGIARDLVSGSLDVIGGGGNPDYDQDGKPITDEHAEIRFKWMPPELWAELKGPNSRWNLVETAGDIRDLAEGKTTSAKPLAMIAAVNPTLQAQRSYPANVARGTADPGAVPFTPGMAKLDEMAIAALKHVGTDPDGFFMMIEGGAVDWAMHANDFPRMIEEYMAFDDAVRAVVAWVDSPESAASWDDTLLVVTADHDHLLYGPNLDEPFQRVTNHGAGKLPGYSWAWSSHSNHLVPFFARGKGAELLKAEADQIDEYTDGQGRKFGYGRYLTQPELGAFLLKTQEK
jgi:alkaline phosphatase